MKVLHAAYRREHSSGFFDQMQMESAAAVKLKIQWTSHIFTPLIPDHCQYSVYVSPPFNLCRFIIDVFPAWTQKVFFDFFYAIWLFQQIPRFDIFLIRHSPTNIGELIFILLCKKTILTVHHSKEIDEKLLLKNNNKFLKALVCFWTKIIFKNVNGLIGVTHEICQYELLLCNKNLPYFVYPNGISYPENKMPFDASTKISTIPTMAFVASSFKPWHGLDRILDFLAKSNLDLKLHLIGNIPYQYVDQITNDPRICAHGFLDSTERKKVFETCHVGIGTLALYRNNMTEACPLKVREYLYHGLPVISANDDIFPKTFSFYSKINPDELHKIYDFACMHMNTDPNIVYQHSMRYIDKISLLLSLHKSLITTAL